MNDLSCLITDPGGKGVMPWTWATVGLLDSDVEAGLSAVLEQPANAKAKVAVMEQDVKRDGMASNR